MEYKIGDKVIFTDEEAHKIRPKCFPAIGTIGEIIEVRKGDLKIKWAKGSTGWRNDLGFSLEERVKPSQENFKEIADALDSKSINKSIFGNVGRSNI